MNVLTKRNAALGLALAMALTAQAAHAEQRLKLSTNSPPNHWSSVEAFVPFMNCVAQRTGSEIGFEFFHSSQLASTSESLSAVNSGLVDVSYLALSALSDSMPLSGISMLPDMGGSAVEMANAFRTALSEPGPLAEEFNKARVHPLFIIMTPPYQFILKGGAFTNVEEIRGKKLRVSGTALSLAVSTLGAVPVEMPPADIYISLQQGVVDGTLLSLPSLPPYSLQEVAGAASRNAALGSATAVLAIDSVIWGNLSNDVQSAITTCSGEVEAHINHYVDDLNQQLASDFARDGVTIFDFSDEALAALNAVLAPVRQDYVSRVSSRGLPAQEAMNQYMRALGR